MTLEKLFQFIVAKEAGRRSAGRLSQSQAIDATSSQYRRAKQDDIKQHKAADSNETTRQRCSCYVLLSFLLENARLYLMYFSMKWVNSYLERKQYPYNVFSSNNFYY